MYVYIYIYVCIFVTEVLLYILYVCCLISYEFLDYCIWAWICEQLQCRLLPIFPGTVDIMFSPVFLSLPTHVVSLYNIY